MIRALALALVLAGCATPERACFTPEWEWPAYKAKMERRGATWIELTEAERDRLLERMNREIHPPTGAQYDRIGYFKSPVDGVVIATYIVGNCLWIVGPASEPMLRYWSRAKEGA